MDTHGTSLEVNIYLYNRSCISVSFSLLRVSDYLPLVSGAVHILTAGLE